MAKRFARRRAHRAADRPAEESLQRKAAATEALRRKPGRCACGGGCPRCAGYAGAGAGLFERRQPKAAPRGTHKAIDIYRNPVIVVRGFSLGQEHCGCRAEIQRNIDFVIHEIENYKACGRESRNGTIADIKACKEQRNEAAGIRTAPMERVSMSGEVTEAREEGLCGAILNHGVNHIHVPVHTDATARNARHDENTMTGGAFARNEVKAHGKELRYLKQVRKALDRQCREEAESEISD